MVVCIFLYGPLWAFFLEVNLNFFKIISKSSIILSLSLIIGCATGGRKAHLKLRELTNESKYSEAISFVKSEEFFFEEHSKLLKLLELGVLFQLSGNYYQSLKIFDKAQNLSNKLFTKSISKKMLSSITNDNLENYYGEKYERSLIRFYQAVNHYSLYQLGSYESYTKTVKIKKDGKNTIVKKIVAKQILTKNQSRKHLSAARATILEWDSLLENYRSVIAGDNTYKIDLMAKLFGAYIHEQIGTRSDLSIAKNLYKDAKKYLFRNYNLYSSFNNKSKKFSNNYSKLPNMSKKKVKSIYVEETIYAKGLIDYIDSRLKDLKKGNTHNLKIIIQDGFIAEKNARRIHFPIPFRRLRSVGSGGGDILSFTADLLSIAAGTIPTISFELPEIKVKNNSSHIFVIVKNIDGKIVKESASALVNPLSDIAAQTLDSKIKSKYTKLGVRLVTKHVAAIAAAYVIFKKSGGGLQGKMLAAISYAAANKLIAASAVVDLRFWSTLPRNMRISSLKLKDGKYNLFLKVKDTQGERVIKSQSFEILKGKKIALNIKLN